MSGANVTAAGWGWGGRFIRHHVSWDRNRIDIKHSINLIGIGPCNLHGIYSRVSCVPEGLET